MYFKELVSLFLKLGCRISISSCDEAREDDLPSAVCRDRQQRANHRSSCVTTFPVSYQLHPHMGDLIYHAVHSFSLSVATDKSCETSCVWAFPRIPRQNDKQLFMNRKHPSLWTRPLSVMTDKGCGILYWEYLSCNYGFAYSLSVITDSLLSSE